MLEFAKLLLNLTIFILPLIFKKGIPYDEAMKKVNELIAQKRKEFERMTEDERSIALSSLVDSVNRNIELWK